MIQTTCPYVECCLPCHACVCVQAMIKERKIYKEAHPIDLSDAIFHWRKKAILALKLILILAHLLLILVPNYRKTDNKYDQCTLAQEQLHPVCSQRGDLGANLPSCNSLAQSCRMQHDCR